MKNYERPMIINFEDASEGIYAASGVDMGTSDPADSVGGAGTPKCWTIAVSKDQANAGGYATFRVQCNHIGTVHISTEAIMSVTFNQSISKAEFEGFNASTTGCTANLTRPAHANAYVSNDQFNSLLKIWAADGTDLATLDVVAGSATISCVGVENVQGGNDFIQ